MNQPNQETHSETEVTVSTAQPARLEDLALTNEQVEEIKGSGLCHGTTVLAWARGDGTSNHNETVAEDETAAEALADLPVEEDEQIKGGAILSESLSGEGKTVKIAFCK